MLKARGLCAVFLVLVGVSPVSAEEAAPSASASVRKDPRGIKGISPFWELVKAGDAAYAARDFDGALVSYRNALKSEPQNANGHYRLGAAQLAKGDLKEARAAWETAQRFAASDPRLKGKILFVLADLAERERELIKAANGWTAYQTHAQQNPQAGVHPASAAERGKRVNEWQSLQEKYAAVKERIEKRLNEAEEASKKAR